jgi:two-component system response regulator FixJ
MSESDSQIYVVDDGVSVREAVGSLIRSAGLSVKTFSSAQETLASLRKELPGCFFTSLPTQRSLPPVRRCWSMED